ncbi:MAG: glycosyltransferase family 2 protein [Verrucomicrobia bacterium]|nr:glycosyltransferase family 2 protein [Verrucomicrobiota bacterium]
MPAAPQVSVVVPLYNEEENVAELQQQITDALRGLTHEIIFVDDGSTDATTQKVATDERVRLLCFKKNAGQSAAMFAGMKAARGDVIVLIDGDLQNDPADIPALVTKLNEGYDLVCGYRKNRKDTVYKRLQSRIANAVRSRFIGDGVRDTGCSLKAMKRECRDALVPFVGLHRFIPAFIRRAGYKLTEVPVNHRPRLHGVSKYNFANRAWRATKDMFGVSWLLSRRMHYEVSESEVSKSV